MRKSILYLASAGLFCFAALNSNAENMQIPAKTINENNHQQVINKNQEQTLIVSNVWARKSTSPNNNSAAYMTIKNPTDKQITIIGASAIGAANIVELHESFVDERGISRMTSINNIVVPANSTIELAPGGMHIMLFDLKRSLKENDKFEISLKIQDKQPISVKATVEAK